MNGRMDLDSLLFSEDKIIGGKSVKAGFSGTTRWHSRKYSRSPLELGAGLGLGLGLRLRS